MRQIIALTITTLQDITGNNSSMHDSLASSWLALQCQMIPDVIEAMAAFDLSSNDPVTPTTCWPKESSVNSDTLAAATLALSRQAPVVSHKGADSCEEGDENLVVACPLKRNGEFFGLVAVKVAVPQEQQSAIIHLLQWGAAWLEMLLAKEDQTAGQSSPALISTLAAALESGNADAAATAAVNKLIQYLACERVSIGLINRRQVHLKALSQNASYEPRSNLIRALEAVMTEAMEQQATILFPPGQSDTKAQNRAHAALSQTEEQEHICTIPLIVNDNGIGAICIECLAGQPFKPSTVKQCEDIAQLLAPVLQMKLHEDRSLISKIREDIFVAPNRRSAKHGIRWIPVISVLLLSIVTAGFIHGDFRITAPATLEGRVQRALVAPFDGYIAEAHRRAGETVKSGEVLAELDDRDIKLERKKLIFRREETVKQYNKALAVLDHAKARISRTQVAQVEARLALIDEQLERTKLQAPFDGVIIAGDLSRSLGTPVERGQIIFEMAPLNEYRVVLQVDEQDIINITAGQEGYLTLAAMPGKPVPLKVEKVASLMQSDEERAVFRVEAQITEPEAIQSLRPGMQGIGKIAVGERSYLWMWTRDMTGWLQLRLWAWLP